MYLKLFPLARTVLFLTAHLIAWPSPALALRDLTPQESAPKRAGLEEALASRAGLEEWGAGPPLRLKRGHRVVIYGFNSSRDELWVSLAEDPSSSKSKLDFVVLNSGNAHVPGDVVLLNRKSLKRVLEKSLEPGAFRRVWSEERDEPEFQNLETLRALRSPAIRQVLSANKEEVLLREPDEDRRYDLEISFQKGDSVIFFNTSDKENEAWSPFAQMSVYPKNESAQLIFSALRDVRIDREDTYRKRHSQQPRLVLVLPFDRSVSLQLGPHELVMNPTWKEERLIRNGKDLFSGPILFLRDRGRNFVMARQDFLKRISANPNPNALEEFLQRQLSSKAHWQELPGDKEQGFPFYINLDRTLYLLPVQAVRDLLKHLHATAHAQLTVEAIRQKAVAALTILRRREQKGVDELVFTLSPGQEIPGSPATVRVNGETVAPGRLRHLSHGDRITLELAASPTPPITGAGLEEKEFHRQVLERRARGEIETFLSRLLEQGDDPRPFLIRWFREESQWKGLLPGQQKDILRFLSLNRVPIPVGVNWFDFFEELTRRPMEWASLLTWGTHVMQEEAKTESQRKRTLAAVQRLWEKSHKWDPIFGGLREFQKDLLRTAKRLGTPEAAQWRRRILEKQFEEQVMSSDVVQLGLPFEDHAVLKIDSSRVVFGATLRGIRLAKGDLPGPLLYIESLDEPTLIFRRTKWEKESREGEGAKPEDRLRNFLREILGKLSRAGERPVRFPIPLNPREEIYLLSIKDGEGLLHDGGVPLTADSLRQRAMVLKVLQVLDHMVLFTVSTGRSSSVGRLGPILVNDREVLPGNPYLLSEDDEIVPREAGLEEAVATFHRGVEQYVGRADQDPYGPLMGTPATRGAMAQYLTAEWSRPFDPVQDRPFKISPEQVIVTPGNRGAVELLIRIAADVTDAPMKAPDERQTISISDKLWDRYEPVATKYLNPIRTDPLLRNITEDLKIAAQRDKRQLPKLIVLDRGSMERMDPLLGDVVEPLFWEQLFRLTSKNGMVVLFDESKPTPGADRLLKLLNENPSWKRSTFFLFDWEERFDLTGFHLGALVSFNDALRQPWMTAAGGSIAAPSQAVQAGYAELLKFRTPSLDFNSLEPIASLPDTPGNRISTDLYQKRGPDPTLSLSPAVFLYEKGPPKLFLREDSNFREELARVLGERYEFPPTWDDVQGIIQQAIAGDRQGGAFERVEEKAKALGVWQEVRRLRSMGPSEETEREIVFLLTRKFERREFTEEEIILLEVLLHIVPLHVGAPGFPRERWVKEAAMAGLTLTDSRLKLEAKVVRAMADYLERTYGVPFAPSEIATGFYGSKTALQEFLLALEAAKQEPVSVFIPSPYYVGYDSSVLTAGIPPSRLIHFKTQPSEQFIPTAEEVEKEIQQAQGNQETRGTLKVLILTSPGNPTSAVIPQQQLNELVGLLPKYPGLFIAIDVAYGQLLFEGEPFQLSGLPEEVLRRIALVGTQSKEVLHPGGRLGWLAVKDPDLVKQARSQRILEADRLALAAQAIVYSDANLGRSDAAIRGHRAHLKTNAGILTGVLRTKGISFVEPAGSFYLLFDEIPGFDPWEIGETSVPGDAFGAEGKRRFSFAGPRWEIEEAARRLDQALSARAAGLEERPGWQGPGMTVLSFDPVASVALSGLEEIHRVAVAETPTDFARLKQAGVAPQEVLGLLWGGLEETDYLRVDPQVGGLIGVDPTMAGWQQKLTRFITHRVGVSRVIPIFGAESLAAGLEDLGMPGAKIVGVLKRYAEAEAAVSPST